VKKDIQIPIITGIEMAVVLNTMIFTKQMIGMYTLLTRKIFM